MLKFLLMIILAIIAGMAVYFLRTMFLVWRFLGAVDVVMLLKEVLFDNTEIYEKYKDKQMPIIIKQYYTVFENFAGAVDFLEQYANEVLEDYKKIIDLTDYYKLMQYEQILNEIITDARIWKWKHGYIQENKDS